MNIAAAKYFGTKMQEIQEIDGQLEIDFDAKMTNVPVLIEYTLLNAKLFKDVVECVVNQQGGTFNEEDLTLSDTKIENGPH